MAVTNRDDFLNMHKQLNLRLVHAAIGTYPCHAEKASLELNRLLLVFADSGRGDSFIRDLSSGKLLPMRKGHAYFIPCGHEIDQHQTNELNFVSFQFNLDIFYGFDVMAKFPECRVIEDHVLINEAQDLIKRQDVPIALCRINEIIYHLCYGWLSEIPEILSQDTKNYRDYQSILDYVEKHGDAQTTVGNLADMSKMRQDVFSRKFTRDLGLSPKEFIIRSLMRKASQLLGTPGMTVKTTAEKLNFTSEYYFSRFFKRHTGIPPSRFQHLSGIK